MKLENRHKQALVDAVGFLVVGGTAAVMIAAYYALMFAVFAPRD